MPIKGITVQHSIRHYDQILIHATDPSWYDETCELRFPTFFLLSWDEFHLRLEWDDNAPGVLTWDSLNALLVYCHKIDQLHVGTQESMGPMKLLKPSSGIIDHMDRLAPQVTSLKLDCKPYRSDKREDIDAAAPRLADFLLKAKELRALSGSINIDKHQT